MLQLDDIFYNIEPFTMPVSRCNNKDLPYISTEFLVKHVISAAKLLHARFIHMHKSFASESLLNFCFVDSIFDAKVSTVGFSAKLLPLFRPQVWDPKQKFYGCYTKPSAIIWLQQQPQTNYENIINTSHYSKTQCFKDKPPL